VLCGSTVGYPSDSLASCYYYYYYYYVCVQCGWYWGAMSLDEAEARLSDLADGSFLVRDSSDDRYILSLSFRSQSTTHHTRIEHYRGLYTYLLTYWTPPSSVALSD